MRSDGKLNIGEASTAHHIYARTHTCTHTCTYTHSRTHVLSALCLLYTQFARGFRALGLQKRTGEKLLVDQEMFKSFDTNGYLSPWA